MGKILLDSIHALTEEIAVLAAQLGAAINIKLADSVILATAEFHEFILWTYDRRLANKSPNIRYLLES